MKPMVETCGGMSGWRVERGERREVTETALILTRRQAGSSGSSSR